MLLVFGRNENADTGAVGLGDDPDASGIGQSICGQDSEALLQTEFVLADVVRVQIAWIETDVFNEKASGSLPLASKADAAPGVITTCPRGKSGATHFATLNCPLLTA